MSIRVRALAVLGVVAVAAGTALITLAALGEPPESAPGTPAGPGPALSALEAASEPVMGDAGPATGLVIQARPLEATPVERPGFDVTRALATVRDLEAFGARAGGSDAEAQAAVFLRDRLTALGLDARIEEFSLPNGTTSRNVVARIVGSADSLFVLGAHMDTKPPSPGANDNASGCGALLEIARLLAADPALPTVEVVFFGSEETSGEDPNAHHYGSRYRVAQMSAAERARTAGMISIDMIGYGPGFHSRTMGRGPMVLSTMLLARAKATGVAMTYLKDPGKSGWSDHEAYELAGIPASWIEWRDDPVYHTAQDTSGHLSSVKVKTAGTLVLGFVRGLDAASLATLTAR